METKRQNRSPFRGTAIAVLRPINGFATPSSQSILLNSFFGHERLGLGVSRSSKSIVFLLIDDTVADPGGNVAQGHVRRERYIVAKEIGCGVTSTNGGGSNGLWNNNHVAFVQPMRHEQVSRDFRMACSSRA